MLLSADTIYLKDTEVVYSSDSFNIIVIWTAVKNYFRKIFYLISENLDKPWPFFTRQSFMYLSSQHCKSYKQHAFPILMID